MPTVREIVKEWLEKNGYDGLYCEEGDCACLTSDLMPCDEGFDRCLAGYKTDGDEDREFHISEKKPEVKEKT